MAETLTETPALAADDPRLAPPPKSAAKAPPRVMGPMIMHYLVPVAKAPAPHMISGEPPNLRKFAEVFKTPFGHQGQGFAPACNPAIATNEQHRGSGEFWALLAVIGNEPAIDPSACETCMATEAWQAAHKTFFEANGVSHPNIKRPELGVAAEPCCGG